MGDVEGARSDLNTLEQLINLLVRHLLAELGEDISQLSGTNEAISFLIKDLETADKFLYNPGLINDASLWRIGEPNSRTRGASRLEPIVSVQNRQKGLIVHCKCHKSSTGCAVDVPKIRENLTFSRRFGNYISDLCLGRVLPQSPQKVTQDLARDGTRSFLVK